MVVGFAPPCPGSNDELCTLRTSVSRSVLYHSPPHLTNSDPVVYYTLVLYIEVENACLRIPLCKMLCRIRAVCALDDALNHPHLPRVRSQRRAQGDIAGWRQREERERQSSRRLLRAHRHLRDPPLGGREPPFELEAKTTLGAWKAEQREAFAARDEVTPLEYAFCTRWRVQNAKVRLLHSCVEEQVFSPSSLV